MLCDNLYNTYSEIRHCLRSDKKQKQEQTDDKNKWPIIALYMRYLMNNIKK